MFITPAYAQTAGAGTDAFLQLVPILLMFVIFYFLLIRPQQKRMRMHQDMMKGLQKGNKIITTGGIIGNVIKFEGEDVVVVEVAPNVRVRMARSAVSEIVTGAAAESANDN